jgi:lysosomal Pro-X carboxypeptidase
MNITVWKQRYFVCDGSWQKPSKDGAEGGPIFFYCGNEAPVELYLNATGFMYESAPFFGALLVFAEHRYYGQSLPFGENSFKHMGYLTHEQVSAINLQDAGEKMQPSAFPIVFCISQI